MSKLAVEIQLPSESLSTESQNRTAMEERRYYIVEAVRTARVNALKDRSARSLQTWREWHNYRGSGDMYTYHTGYYNISEWEIRYAHDSLTQTDCEIIMSEAKREGYQVVDDGTHYIIRDEVLKKLLAS